MTVWKVVRKSDMYFVEGLEENDWSRSLVEPRKVPDTELFYINKYGEYVDGADDAGELQVNLYQLFNTDDRIKEGDEFVTPFGRFYCYKIHVVTAGMRDVLMEYERRERFAAKYVTHAEDCMCLGSKDTMDHCPETDRHVKDAHIAMFGSGAEIFYGTYDIKRGYPKLSREERQEMDATNMSEPGPKR